MAARYRSQERSVDVVESISYVSDQARVVLDRICRSAAFAAGDGSIDMMSGPHTRIVSPLTSKVNEPPRQTLRLSLKPKAPTTGYVDGAWWPWSSDLAAEL